VVDDEESMRDTLQIMLKREGFEVETAGDGGEALEKCANMGFDLVITDLKMPGLDGIGMLEGFQQRGDVPVIVMTAYATKEQAIAALNLGASFLSRSRLKKRNS